MSCYLGDRKQPTKPLIRLRVEYSNEMEFFNPIRFGQQFADRVANPTDMILLKRERRPRRAPEENPLDHDAMGSVLQQEVVSEKSKQHILISLYIYNISYRLFLKKLLMEKIFLQTTKVLRAVTWKFRFSLPLIPTV